MPADRTLAEGLATDLVRLYRDLEQRIATHLSGRLQHGLDRPGWEVEKLTAVSALRVALQRMLAALDADVDGRVEQAIALAYARGGTAATEELIRLGRLTGLEEAALRAGLPQLDAIQRMSWTLASTLRGTHLRVLRWSLDVYRQVVAETVLTGTLTGTQTRVRTAQRAWERLLSQGVTGFTDRAGRNWELASYVEMATRTATAQAAVEGHLDRLADVGVDLVIVSNAPQECVRCRPWEGKVLSRRGPAGPHAVEVEHATRDGEMVTVQVAGSVDAAIAAGLLHPQCRHSLSGFTPGITRVPTHTADPEGDAARQHLRALERRVRRAKLEAQAVIDPAARPRLHARVRDLQGQIREHVDATPGLLRQRHREQIGTAR